MSNGTEVCFPEGSEAVETCAPVQTPVSAALSTLMQSGQVSHLLTTLLFLSQHSPQTSCRMSVASQADNVRTK